ncbi:UNVERIFIED_ORG: hypothetical protein M2414_005371 [Rahnella aquatilis]
MTTKTKYLILIATFLCGLQSLPALASEKTDKGTYLCKGVDERSPPKSYDKVNWYTSGDMYAHDEGQFFLDAGSPSDFNWEFNCQKQ